MADDIFTLAHIESHRVTKTDVQTLLNRFPYAFLFYFFNTLFVILTALKMF